MAVGLVSAGAGAAPGAAAGANNGEVTILWIGVFCMACGVQQEDVAEWNIASIWNISEVILWNKERFISNKFV